MDRYLESLVAEERFAFYQIVSDFGAKEIAPHVLGWERQHRLLPEETIAAMGGMGLFGLTVDEQYGGQGGDLLDLVLMGLALGYWSQSVAITPGAAASLGIRPLQLSGNEKQKAAHLPDLAAGKRMCIFGLSEPGRGSDAANPQVTATRTGSTWRLRGEKCWSTNAKWASHIIVHALTDADGPAGHRSTCFLVPMDDPQVHYQEMQGKQVWQQSSTGSIALDNVDVGDEAIIGEVNEGFKVMVQTLNGGRLFIAALSLASLAFGLDRCRSYAQERIQFDDQPIGRFQRVQDVVLDMDIALEQGLTWLISLVHRYNAGTLPHESAAKVKIECSRRTSDLYTLAMEMCGGIASLDEFGLARHARDLFVCRVGEGSNFALKTLATKLLMPAIAHLLQ
jgi:alkylation response protein AidB-like acyl-CoA dehydrogenase